MKRKLIAFIISLVMLPAAISAQSYDALWKKVEEARRQDLPRRQMDALSAIAAKARAENNHGQLLEAELRHASVLLSVTPDSLLPVVRRFEQAAENAERNDSVLAAVYYSVLGRIYKNNTALGDDHGAVSREYYRKSLANPELLASVTVDGLGTVVKKGADSRIFGNDMLSMLCMEAGDYKTLSDRYGTSSDRTAAMMSAYMLLNNEGGRGNDDFIASLDSLIDIYSDLPECGELAMRRYSMMTRSARFDKKDRMDYISYALGKWGNVYDMNALVDARNVLTQPLFMATAQNVVAVPGLPYTVSLPALRNVGMVRMTLSLLNGIDGTTKLDPGKSADYKKLKAQVAKDGQKTYIQKYEGRPDYEDFSDSIVVDGLKRGVYLVEITADKKGMGTQKSLLYVTDLYVLQQQLPGKKIRYAVVSATTGQPVPGAKLWISSRNKGAVTVTCGGDGEYMHSYGVAEPDYVRPYTAADKAYPQSGVWSRFSYYPDKYVRDYVNLYTDRAIYRPGQTVHVSAVAFSNKYGKETKANAGRQMRLTLKDANRRTVGETAVTTDDFGTASADFTLPATGLAGRFSVLAECGTTSTHYFSVEEYKRPTFTVEFDEVDGKYVAGDTLTVKGRAMTYAGVPVQGAKVEYEVTRSRALWWRWNYAGGGGEELYEGEAVTDADGTFEVRMPMLLPDDEDDEDNGGPHYRYRPARFYTVTAMADVTDVAGETRNGQLALPLGNKPVLLDCLIPDKTERDSLKTITFVLKNAAGKDIAGDVSYRVDNSAVRTVRANTPVQVAGTGAEWLASGRHKLTAVCGTDTIEKEFVLFSIDDKTPCVRTDEWFYTSSDTFGRDGRPVYVQVGSSDEDVHVLYTAITGNTVTDSRVIKLSNSVETAMFKDSNDLEDGVLLNFAWVKNGVMHSYTTEIRRPLPDKRLMTKWTTFRDRLTPGQKEEWTLNIVRPDGTPAAAQLMAVLYDKSLDSFTPNRWAFNTQIGMSMPSTRWTSPYHKMLSLTGRGTLKRLAKRTLAFNRLDDQYFVSVLRYGYNVRIGGTNIAMAEAKMLQSSAAEKAETSDMLNDVVTVGYGTARKAAMTGSVAMDGSAAAEDAGEGGETAGQGTAQPVQVRENMSETAFFYPALAADGKGNVSIKFTLPESVTTWRFMGLAHDKDMNNGFISGEAVAKKDVMVQPNMPRFVRAGDNATISARVFNTSDSGVKGMVRLELADPDTEKVIYKDSRTIDVAANATGSVTFGYVPDGSYTLLICRVTVEGKTFGDGEQHYLPVLPSAETVTNTVPFVCTGAGVTRVNVGKMFPEGARNGRLTVEYTNSPAWLAVQALPFVANANENNAISLAAAYYANSLGAHIVRQSPRIKTVFEQWRREPAGSESTLMSALERNQELKTLVLDETPWVADAGNEADRKRRISGFFDESVLVNRMEATLGSLRRLQNSDGSWSWWKGMEGSLCITMEVAEFLVRLNTLAGEHTETAPMLGASMKYLGSEVVREVREMRRMEKEGTPFVMNGYHALQFLYINALAGRTLTAKEKDAAGYLMDRLKKEKGTQSIYAKALMAVVLAKEGKAAEAREYVRSLKEYSVATETMGRYYDTPRAGYSWFDYRIPTQVAAMEAIAAVTPDDVRTIDEMRLWLLQQKRTQDWSTPINSVNAIYALLNGNTALLDKGENAVLAVDGKTLGTSAATAGIGYVKAQAGGEGARTFTATKTSDGVSWGALYAQFTQDTDAMEAASSGIEVRREILVGGKVVSPAGAKAAGGLAVGSRVKVRITVRADRDYDFVQVVDKRAACLEPVEQLTGYGWGYYCTSKDYTTNFYFDRMRKGTYTIEKEYYVDRAGAYSTGTCTVQCAYAPEFAARDRSLRIEVE